MRARHGMGPGTEARHGGKASRRSGRIAVAALAAVGLAWVAPRAASAQQAQRAILASKLRSQLETIAREVPGVVGIHVVDLTSSERFGVNDTLVFAQGSAIKVALLTELYAEADAGKLDLAERVPVRRVDQAGGSGVLQGFGDGTSLVSLHDLAVLMVVLSDNTATNMLVDRVGMDAVNRRMTALGFPHIRFQRKMIRPEESARGNENLATPAEAAGLMARIARCELPMSAARCAEMRGVLEIPKSGSFPDPIPAGIKVAWKPGTIEGVETAWGIVGLRGRPYAVAVMVNYSNAAAASDAIRRASATVFDHFSRLAGATAWGTRVPVELMEKLKP
ncbi:MAG TPA: serine hydrolase [Longimicrobiales bacterium]|nr:serine hydrolase [Longimicrobiales bacterium]